MSDAIDPKFLDARLANRAMRRGQLTAKAYDKHLKGLPDSGEKAVPVEAEMEAVDLPEREPKKKGRAQSEE